MAALTNIRDACETTDADVPASADGALLARGLIPSHKNKPMSFEVSIQSFPSSRLSSFDSEADKCNLDRTAHRLRFWPMAGNLSTTVGRKLDRAQSYDAARDGLTCKSEQGGLDSRRTMSCPRGDAKELATVAHVGPSAVASGGDRLNGSGIGATHTPWEEYQRRAALNKLFDANQSAGSVYVAPVLSAEKSRPFRLVAPSRPAGSSLGPRRASLDHPAQETTAVLRTIRSSTCSPPMVEFHGDESRSKRVTKYCFARLPEAPDSAHSSPLTQRSASQSTSLAHRQSQLLDASSAVASTSENITPSRTPSADRRAADGRACAGDGADLCGCVAAGSGADANASCYHAGISGRTTACPRASHLSATTLPRRPTSFNCIPLAPCSSPRASDLTRRANSFSGSTSRAECLGQVQGQSRAQALGQAQGQGQGQGRKGGQVQGQAQERQLHPEAGGWRAGTSVFHWATRTRMQRTSLDGSSS